jgi:hypothetical protein
MSQGSFSLGMSCSTLPSDNLIDIDVNVVFCLRDYGAVLASVQLANDEVIDWLLLYSDTDAQLKISRNDTGGKQQYILNAESEFGGNADNWYSKE